MGRYSGDKKTETVENKIKNNNKSIKLVVTNWIDGILTKVEYFFDDYETTFSFSENQKGQIK